MIEAEVQIQTPDGAMNAFTVHPEGEGPFPAVIQYFDALGLREEIRAMARRYSEDGFFVIAPDLYHRFGNGIHFEADADGQLSAEQRTEMFGYVDRLTDAMVMADTAAVLEFLEDAPLALDAPKGAVGYCLGGRAVIRAMAEFSDEIRSGAALHPSQTVSDGADSPHLGIARFNGDAEIYIGFGGQDHLTPPPVIAAVTAQLEQAGVQHVVDVTEDAQHGFTMASRAAYNAEADRLHWARTLDLFERRLG
ncbi:MAG TPA: dienelactone hydrolase family protein [Baekduia sp.]|nr:dienelactone hydrolase family protein [Baekduia sp.]